MENENYIHIEHAKLIFRNFSGQETRYNRAGARNFCVVIDDENLRNKLSKDGWYIKPLKPREEGDPITYRLKVNINYKSNRPPVVHLISGKGRTELTEETIGNLDYADISNVDVTISPWFYENNEGKRAISGYLKTMWVTIEQDPFASKYAEEEFPGEEPF